MIKSDAPKGWRLDGAPATFLVVNRTSRVLPAISQLVRFAAESR